MNSSATETRNDAPTGEIEQVATPTDGTVRYDNELIRASAGTGKTFHLSNRYLRLVLNDVPVSGILATTFTRQAAREILDRILFRLATAAESEDGAAELAEAIGLSAHDGFRQECLNKLRELTVALPRVRVSTLDAFFSQIAQAFSLEIGLPPGWRIVEETEETTIRSKAIDAYLGIGKPERVVKLMQLLSKGKVERNVSRMISDTVIELYNLFLDSDVRAWNRMSQAATLSEVELQEAIIALNACDIDSFDVVKAFAPAKHKDCQQAAARQWDEFLSNGIAKNLCIGLKTYGRGKNNQIPDELEARYQPLVQHAIASLRNQVIIQTESTHALLKGFHSQYEQLKLETRSLRFDDINRALLPFSRPESFRQIAFRMNGQIEHLLLDEFQDTSLDQWRVIRPFAESAAQGKDQSFFCVGDVKQAIYGWRGGDADILDQMDRQLPNVKPLELSHSYRSSAAVIDFVNRVNSGITNHCGLDKNEEKAAAEWCDSFPTHETARTELSGHVTIETARLPESEDETPHSLVIDRCAELVAEAVRKHPDASVAVLTRSNDAVAKTIFRLQQSGVKASELGGNPLTDSAAVQLILSRLKLADHPGDSVAFFHLQNSPWSAMLELGTQESPFVLSERTRRDLSDLGYGVAIERWAEQLKRFCNTREWRRLRQLVELAYVYQQTTEQPSQLGFSSQFRLKSRTHPFIKKVETERVADPSTDQVAVMTVHKSKGLQFDIVFIVELDKSKPQTPKCVSTRKSPFEGITQVSRYVSSSLLSHLPATIQTLHQNHRCAQFREDLCVLYVALTRAIHGLHLVVAPNNPKVKQKQLPKTAAGIIRAAVNLNDPLEPLATVATYGNPQWQQPGKTVKSAIDEAPKEMAPQPIRFRPRSENVLPGASPSRREGGGRIRVADRLCLQSSSAMLYGTVLHAWFEQIQWLHTFDVDAQKPSLLRIAKQLGMPNKQAGIAFESFRSTLVAPEIQRLLNEESFLETYFQNAMELSRQGKISVRNEQPISAIVDDQVTSGLVDRLVCSFDRDGQPSAAAIIDYKTDVLDTTSQQSHQAKIEFYRPQLAAYQQAISDMLRIDRDNVASYLVFVHAGLVVALDK